MCKTLYTRNTYQNTWTYNWKARYSFIQWFFEFYENYYIKTYKTNWLKIVIFAKIKEGLHNSDLI